jgi:ribonuclease BN (tRNA processing enzyme)
VQVTVLGKSPSWQDRGGACSGYLIEAGGVRLLLDCGSGVFAKLREVCDYVDVNAIVLTHLHADHILDLVPFASALRYSGRQVSRRPALWGPPGAIARLDAFTSALWGEDTHGLGVAFDLHEYDPGTELDLGPVRLHFCEVPHFITAFAVEVREAADGARFTFGSDSGPNPQLAAFARGTDVLMLEATLGAQEPPADEFRGHMTARDAGELARAAQAGRLVVTHFSDELDPAAVRALAQAGFGGEVELAEPGLRLSI